MYFEAILRTGKKISFEANGPDAGMNKGNKEARAEGTTMIAIKKLTTAEAKAVGLVTKKENDAATKIKKKTKTNTPVKTTRRRKTKTTAKKTVRKK